MVMVQLVERKWNSKLGIKMVAVRITQYRTELVKFKMARTSRPKMPSQLEESRAAMVVVAELRAADNELVEELSM